jgi:MoaA/NifB/PqqE/SkfB family radical SAM enzyme
VIIQPPLLLSRHFIDYPALTAVAGCQAAAVLRERAWDLEILDGFGRPGAGLQELGEQAWMGEGRASFLGRLGSLDADLVLITGSPFLCAAPGRAWLARLAGAIPARERMTVAYADMFVGGMHYIEYDGRKLLRDCPRLNALLRHECEPALGRLAESIEGGGPLRGVLENRRPFPLDDLPAPAWDLLDIERYFEFLHRVLSSSWRLGPFPPEPRRTLPIVTARGCTFGCIFCSKNPGLPEPRRQYRPVPWPCVETWVREWKRRFRLERVVVLDEVANLRKDRFDALLALLSALGLRAEFPNGLRADLLAREQIERLSDLTSAISVSLESASPRVQRNVLRKNLDWRAVERVAGWCSRAGLALGVHAMLGIPGERRAEAAATLSMCADLGRRFGVRPMIQFAVPIPGTPMARRTKGRAAGPADFYIRFQRGGPLWDRPSDRAFVKTAADAFDRTFGVEQPRKVIINLTYRCNNHCQFCAVGDRPQRDADAERVKRTLDEQFARGVSLLDIDGGEPTLHDRLFEIIGHAARLGYRQITVTTNARRASYSGFANRLARSGATGILVSLHAADPAVQDWITGVGGSHRQTLAGLRELLRAAPDPGMIGVNTTVFSGNIGELRPLARLLASIGVRRWNIQAVTPFGRALPAHQPDARRLREECGRLLSRPPRGLKIQVINLPPCAMPRFEKGAAADFGKASRQMVFVGEDGVNLQEYLSGRRKRISRCRRCAYAPVCPGVYDFKRPPNV